MYAFLLIFGSELQAQSTYRVLFLGNSYTAFNNLPQLVHDVAISAGDTLIFDSHTPGGYQLVDHFIDSTSQNKIMAGNWDYVVIQGQSQEPIVATSQFINGGNALFQLTKQYNPCAVVMPYMTWGRKNGDSANCPGFPVMCTYQGMDTTLRNAYLNLTSALNGEVTPVSVVWNYLRLNHPGIELYQPDESHPSVEGSYAAACSFYATIFKKNPNLITFDFGINATDASIIRNAVKTQVFDSLQLWDYKKPPVAKITYQAGSGLNELIFNAVIPGIQQTYAWDFGDGTTGSNVIETHSYLNNGTFTVSLTTSTCDLQGMNTSYTDTVVQFCNHTPTVYTSQPWVCNVDTIWTQPADSYQWYEYGIPIPETNQFLVNYLLDGNSGVSVISTLNGCSELSQIFTDSPQWSGYYFDAIGDPCVGDTVAFAVLHINGFLSGQENILWFKNDTLLNLMTNEDTLLINAEGKYECKVIDPTSNCPIDTTSYVINYDCDVVGIVEINEEINWYIYPNPASDKITIFLSNSPNQQLIEIYNALGYLAKEIQVKENTQLDISDLLSGLYFIKLKNNTHPPLKFVKM